MNVLVLEASTSSAKAMIYSDAEGVLRTRILRYPKAIGSGGTQDAEGTFRLLAQAAKALTPGLDISAVAIVGIWHSLLLTKKGVPVSPVYTWAYAGAAGAAARYYGDPELRRRIYGNTGCMPHSTYPVYDLIHLRENGLDTDGCEIGGMGEYLFSKLTGERGVSVNMASGSGMLNRFSLRWDEEMLGLAGISESRLSPLYDHHFHARIADESADLLGVSRGIPVTLPYSDGCMNQLGAGAYRKGIMTMSVGTSCAIRLISENPLPDTVRGGLWEYCGIGSRIEGAATSGGTNCVNWFQKAIGAGRPLEELDRSVGGGDLPVFLPFIFGERCPGWNAGRRGGFSGLSGNHDAAAMYSALLQGILFNVFQCFEILKNVAGVSEINLSGGILYSPVWTQMAADIWGMDMHLPRNEQASMLGGACMALYALGKITDFADFGREENRIIRPDPEKHRYYRDRYERYLKAYDAEMHMEDRA